MTFTLKWQFHWAVLSLQMASWPFSIWSWYWGCFAFESLMRGKKKGNSVSGQSWPFLSFSYISFPVLPFPFWQDPCAFALHLHGSGICVIPELQLSGNYSATTDQKRGREGERLCEYNHSRKQISHDNIFCLFQIGLELFYSSEMPKDKWGLVVMNVKFAYLQTGLWCWGCEGTPFPPTHYTRICPFIPVLSNKLLMDGEGLVRKAWVLYIRDFKDTLTWDPHFTNESPEHEW